MRKKKIIVTFGMVLLLIMLISNVVLASDSISNPIDNPSSFKPSNMSNADRVMNIGNTIIGIIQFVGSFASVIVLIVLGIKYMTGSIEEKAEYKKTMFPYVIGAILVFGLTNILAIVNAVVSGVLKS